MTGDFLMDKVENSVLRKLYYVIRIDDVVIEIERGSLDDCTA